MDIFKSLRRDHDLQRALVDQMVETHGDSARRAELFSRVTDQLKRHATAEERCFYVPLLEHDLTQEKARHSVAEHHEIDELIAELDTTEYSSPGWLATAKRLAHRVHHHLDEEEHEVFQLAGKVLSDDLKLSLAEDYLNEMEIQREASA
jgi:hemerythrin-like domain-containing protein